MHGSMGTTTAQRMTHVYRTHCCMMQQPAALELKLTMQTVYTCACWVSQPCVVTAAHAWGGAPCKPPLRLGQWSLAPYAERVMHIYGAYAQDAEENDFRGTLYMATVQ